MKLESGKSVLSVKSDEEANCLTYTCITFIINLITMRRLHRTLLVITAGISFIGFLLYKHEYDRLSNLLHVLHTFGQSSCAEQTTRSFSNEVFASYPNSLLGVWQRIGPIFAYSAVWDSELVKIFAMISTASSIKDIHFTKCIIRQAAIDNGTHSEFESSLSIETEVLDMYFRSQPQERWKTVYIICRCPQSNTIPYSVLLTTGDEKSHKVIPSIPITRLHHLPPRSKSANMSMAICAPVTSQNSDKLTISQFIQFHSYIGVNRISLYAFDISPDTLRQINEVQLKVSETAVQLLPWNFPSELKTNEKDVASYINMMRRDCVLRHSDQHYAILINTDQLVVPRYHSHLSSLLHDEQELLDSMGMAKLALKTFCAEFKSDSYIKLLPDVFPMFLKTYWSQPTDEEKETSVIINPKAIKGFSLNGAPAIKADYHTLQVDSEIAAIHTYRNCGPNASYAHFDNVIYRKFGSHFLPNLNL